MKLINQLSEDEIDKLDLIIKTLINKSVVTPNDLPPIDDNYFSRAKEIKSKDYSYFLEIINELDIAKIDQSLDGTFRLTSLPNKTKKFYDAGGFKAMSMQLKKKEENRKEIAQLEFSKLQWDTKVSKFQAKTRWWPLIISVISLIISIIVLFTS
jgi:hypothetical protein